MMISHSCCECVYPQVLRYQTNGSCRKLAYFLLEISSLYAIRTTRGQVHSVFALSEAQNNSLLCDLKAVRASLLRVYRQVQLTVRYSFEELRLLALYGHQLTENTVTRNYKFILKQYLIYNALSVSTQNDNHQALHKNKNIKRRPVGFHINNIKNIIIRIT